MGEAHRPTAREDLRQRDLPYAAQLCMNRILWCFCESRDGKEKLCNSPPCVTPDEGTVNIARLASPSKCVTLCQYLTQLFKNRRFNQDFPFSICAATSVSGFENLKRQFKCIPNQKGANHILLI